MVKLKFEVDPDVRSVRTPPAQLYGDPAWHTRINDTAWSRAWQYLERLVISRESARDPVVIPFASGGEPMRYSFRRLSASQIREGAS